MDECPFGIHQIEFVIQTAPGLRNGSRVRKHTNSPMNLKIINPLGQNELEYFGQIPSRYHTWWLIIDANFESGWAPIHKLDASFRLHLGNCGIHVFWHHIATVEQTDGHVFALPRITFHHLIGRIKTHLSDFRDGKGLMIGLKLVN
jgi:hypothetical protein